MPRFIDKDDDQNLEYDEFQGEEGVEASEDYHDDPIVVVKKDHSRLVRGFGAFVILIISASYYLSTSIGGRVTLNSGANPIIFGQGKVLSSGCAGSTSLEITASSTLDINSNEFKIKSLTVSNVPPECTYKDLVVTAYDALGNNQALSLNTQNSSKMYTYKRSNYTFELGKFSTGLSISTNSSGSYTIQIASPIAPSASIDKFTVESRDHEEWLCKDGGDCRVGDAGPGGGTVFFVRSEGFKCGPNYTSTGSPTAGLCHFLEVAPANWASTTGKGGNVYNVKFATNYWDGTYDKWGEGLKLTNNIFTSSLLTLADRCQAAPYDTVANCNYVHSVTRLYRGGGRDDWYAPNVSEAKTLCDWLWSNSCASTNTTTSQLPYISAYTAGNTIVTSSTKNENNRIYTIYMSRKQLTCSGNTIGAIGFWDPSNLNANRCLAKFVLPIRAF